MNHQREFERLLARALKEGGRIRESGKHRVLTMPHGLGSVSLSRSPSDADVWRIMYRTMQRAFAGRYRFQRQKEN